MRGIICVDTVIPGGRDSWHARRWRHPKCRQSRPSCESCGSRFRPKITRSSGSSPRRKEDQRLLTGHGRFVDDLARDGMLFLGVVRSAEAHARLMKVDTAAARALPGVALAWSAADLGGIAPNINVQFLGG